MTDRHRQTELIVESAEFLKFRIAFRCFTQLFMHGLQINSVQILFFRQWLILADMMMLFRNVRRNFDQIPPGLLVRQYLIGDPGAHLGPDRFGFRSIIHVIHHRQDHTRQQQIKQRIETVPPGTEDSCHFLLMSGACRTGCTSAEPVSPVDDVGKERDEYRKHIEIAQGFDVIRIDETFPGYPVGHHRDDLIPPGKIQQDIQCETENDRISHQPLKRICDQQCH